MPICSYCFTVCTPQDHLSIKLGHGQFEFIVVKVFVCLVLLFSATVDNTVHINYRGFLTILKNWGCVNYIFFSGIPGGFVPGKNS